MSESMNSILSASLEHLRTNKHTLAHIIADPQREAIESHEPLVLVNAGPNVGTMAILLYRVDYMTRSEIDYDKIVVISATSADHDNYTATNRFTGNWTQEKFAKQISGKYPIRYKHFIINGITDNNRDNIATILQYASEHQASVFIIGDANSSTVMSELMNSDTFVTYTV